MCALDLSNVPIRLLKARYDPKTEDLYIAQVKVSWMFQLQCLQVSGRHCLSHIVGLCWEYRFSDPKNIPFSKVDAGHMNRGCGNLLLEAAEEHSHRCLASATRD